MYKWLAGKLFLFYELLGSQPRVVGKRTPRFPVSHDHENFKGENYFSPTRRGLKLKGENVEDVAQSQNRRSDSQMSSPCQSAEKMVGALSLVTCGISNVNTKALI